MGRNNFSVKVLSKKGKHLEVELTVIREGQEEFYCAKNFALQLIYNIDSCKHAENLKRSPLGKAISPEDLFDKEWLMLNENGFIADIKIRETKNYPLGENIQNLTDEQINDFWKDKTKLPKAIYSIDVTDVKWIEHIHPRQKWEAALYDFFLT